MSSRSHAGLWMRTPRRVRVGALIVYIASACLGFVVIPAGLSQALAVPRPVSTHPMADPGVILNGGQFVGFLTGAGLQESTAPTAAGPWTTPTDRLSALPPWAGHAGVWAPDAIHVGNGWVVYFAAVLTPKAGATKPDPGARCIGTAVSSSATGPFTASATPLVCLPGYGAADAMSADPADRVASAGAIDPSPSYVTINGESRLYLVYKTQELPATIRMVRLSITDGRTVLGDSHQLLSSVRPSSGGYTFADTIEAPSLIQRGGYFILFVAHGNYGLCSYSTQWFVSTHIWSWTNTGARSLLTGPGTHLCGPGGADVTASKVAGQNRLFFHGWVCASTTPCATGAGDPGSRRLMYCAVLTWSADGYTPVVDSYIDPAN